jgi:hypothetical protein
MPMPMIPFADNFLAGSLLSLLLPVGLLIALAIWLVRTVARLPDDPATTAAPPPSVSGAQHDAARSQIDTGSGGS